MAGDVTRLSIYIHGVNKEKFTLLIKEMRLKILDLIHVALYRVQGSDF
jgi:hypothetical protein